MPERTLTRLVSIVGVAIVLIAIPVFIGVLVCTRQGRELREIQIARIKSEIKRVRDGKEDSIEIYGEYADAQLRCLRETRVAGLREVYLNVADATDAGVRYIRAISLRELKIHGGIGIGDRGMASLAGHPNLEKLSLVNTQVTDRGIAVLRELPQLTTLTLKWDTRSSYPITDQSLVAIAEIPRLQTLTIGGKWYTQQAIETLKKKRPNLKITEDKSF